MVSEAFHYLVHAGTVEQHPCYMKQYNVFAKSIRAEVMRFISLGALIVKVIIVPEKESLSVDMH